MQRLEVALPCTANIRNFVYLAGYVSGDQKHCQSPDTLRQVLQLFCRHKHLLSSPIFRQKEKDVNACAQTQKHVIAGQTSQCTLERMSLCLHILWMGLMKASRW